MGYKIQTRIKCFANFCRLLQLSGAPDDTSIQQVEKTTVRPSPYHWYVLKFRIKTAGFLKLRIPIRIQDRKCWMRNPCPDLYIMITDPQPCTIQLKILHIFELQVKLYKKMFTIKYTRYIVDLRPAKICWEPKWGNAFNSIELCLDHVAIEAEDCACQLKILLEQQFDALLFLALPCWPERQPFLRGLPSGLHCHGTSVKARGPNRGFHDDESPNNVSPNEKSWTFRPLDSASLRRCGLGYFLPWTWRPWSMCSDPALQRGTCQEKLLFWLCQMAPIYYISVQLYSPT